MKRFIKWQQEYYGTPDPETKEEGVNPTDVDSAGEDQSLDNTGVPYNYAEIEKVGLMNRDAEEKERDYQMKIFHLTQKKTGDDDPNYNDPTKGPHGSTEGGTFDQKIKDYLKQHIIDSEKEYQDIQAQRNKSQVGTTSTYFVSDPNQFFARQDVNPSHGNADKSTDAVDKQG